MDFSSINISSIIMIFVAIGLFYLAVCVFGSVGRVICIFLGTLLLMFVLQQIGVTIPIIGDLSKFFFDAVAVVFENLQDFLTKIRG